MNLTVAAVIPTHRPGHYLVETLRSLEQQTRPPVEVLVVDDGSDPPVTLPRATSVPVRLLRTPHRGISAARNAGIAGTTAPLVHVCDHDDLVEPRFYERLTRALSLDPEASVAYGDCGFIDAWGGPLPGRLPGIAVPESLTATEALARLVRWNPIASVAAVFRREIFDAVDGFRPFDFVQDWDFWIRAGAAGARFAFVPELLARHRVHPGQQSSPARRREALAESLRMLAGADVPAWARPRRARGVAELRLELARAEADAGRHSAALAQTIRAARRSPYRAARVSARVCAGLAPRRRPIPA